MPGGLVTQQIRHHVVRNNGVGGIGIASVGGGGGGGGGGSSGGGSGGVGFTCSQFYGHGPSTLFHNLFKMNYININVDETDNNTAANSNNNNNTNNNNNNNTNNSNNSNINNNNNNINNNDLLQIGSLKPRYIMDDIFHREEERLKTFVNWPLDWLNKNDLAMTGMFYMGEDDKCKCYFCEVEIGRWEHGDEPVSEHLRWSPNCPLLRRRTTNNVPLNAEALDSILPAPSYDICGLNDTIEVRPQAIVDEVRTNNSAQLAGSTSNPNTNNGQIGEQFIHYYPDYPEYAIETARLRSYAEWPRHMKQKPKELAEAGFFYTGMGDRVKCFSCGGGLKDWDENDDPWEEHAMWMSKCRYLKLMKGQSYIDAVLAKHKSKEMEKLNNKPQNDDEDKEQATTTATATATATAMATATASSAVPTAATAASATVAVSPADIVADDSSRSNCCSETVRKLTNSSIPEEKICKICYNAEYNTAFLPCGHVVACAKCASSVTKCPMCRKPFTDVMRVYFS